RPADDHRALAALADDPEIWARAKGKASVALLWDVCQIPDFQKIWTESHIRLVADLFRALVDRGRLSAAQLGEAVERLDRADGDIDTLMQRLAQVRTWTYVTHRADWTEDAAGWRERTRAIEDRLSDALHDRLTQRFVDRRASTLKRALKRGDQLMSAIAADGGVVVEGQPIGRLAGFVFIPDLAADRDETKALLTAARRALSTETPALVSKFEAADDAAIRLDDAGTLLWKDGEDRESPVARLTGGDHALSPQVKLIESDLLEGALRDRVQARLENWTTIWLVQTVGPLTTLRRAIDAPESGLEAGGRAVAYQTLEGLGATRAEPLRAQIKALGQDERKAIARLGLRLGVDFVFMPDMMKPKPATAAALLYALSQNETPTAPPLWLAGGRTSAPAEDGVA
ncbi:MAG: disulfide oxidoreductase, partial [Pseudomonadota bacterium]